MAFFTDWVKKIGSVFTPKRDVEPVALVLSKADGSPDMAQSDGSGALMINLAAGEGLATEAKQDDQIVQETAINAHVHAIDASTVSIDGHAHSIDGKTPALGTAAMAASSPVTIATDDTLTLAIKNDVDKIPSKGTAAMTGSTPVTIATDDTLTLAIKNDVDKIPSKGTAAMAAAMPVTIASDDTVMTSTAKVKVHDGTTTADVTAASTAATAANKGLVVALSPNSPAFTAIGTWTPVTVAAAGNSGVIKAAACRLGRVKATNVHATISYYLLVFDLAAVPGNGTAPRYPAILLVPGQTLSDPYGGSVHANGVCWAASTTADTLTAAATNPMQCSAEVT